MNEAQYQSIVHHQNLINSNVDKEELLHYLQEEFKHYTVYFINAKSDVTVSVSDVLIFLKDVPEAFSVISRILSEECQQSFIVETLQEFILKSVPSPDKNLKVDLIKTDGSSETDCFQEKESEAGNVHTQLLDVIIADISDNGVNEILLCGPKGSGKSSLLNDIKSELHSSHNFECLSLALDRRRFPFILGKLNYFLEKKTFVEKRVVLLDSCDHSSLLRLKECSIYSEMKSKGIVIIVATKDNDDAATILTQAKNYKMPTCSRVQIEHILKSNFDFSGSKYEALKTSVENYPRYPLHVILMGSLFVSVKESQIEFMKRLPSVDHENDFVNQTLKAIIDTRRSSDELYVMAAVAMYHDLGGAHLPSIIFLLHKLKYDENLITQCLNNMIDCKLLTVSDEKYFLYANFLSPLMTIEQFSNNVWKEVLSQFCLEYLKYCEIIIDNLSMDKNVTKDWNGVKIYIIKALTHDIPINDSLSALIWIRCRIVAKLKPLWQSRLLTFIECVDIYESVTIMIEQFNCTLPKEMPQLLSLERTIWIQYLSLFFYFQKVTESKGIFPTIFSNINRLNKSLTNPHDELYFEFVHLIIEYKIQEGNLEDATKDLIELNQMEQKLDISKDSVALNKIRLAQLKILSNKDLDTVDLSSENFSCTPLAMPQLITTKLRMSKGDLYYMQNDFVTTAWNYNMALYGLDDLDNSGNILLKGEYSKLKQEINCRLGKLGLHSSEKSELNQSLHHFNQCQKFHENVEGSKHHKYIVYAAVTLMLMGENSKALYYILDYIKYFPNRPFFIAVTDLDAQQTISKNLQERLKGNELQFIDNHVYQGKVNFLYLIKANYDWVKNQANDEIIEIDVEIPERIVRANVLQFPSTISQSNKCLVVVFLESMHQRHYSDRTDASIRTDASMSSFRSGIIDDLENVDLDDRDDIDSPPHSIVDSVYQQSLNIARDVIDRAKTGFIQSLTTSIFDRMF